MTPSIQDLADRVAGLSGAEQRIFEHIFSLDSVRGSLKLPSAMLPWAAAQFGAVERVTSQKIIRITNRITLESSVYNPLRALRPHNFDSKAAASAEDTSCIDRFATPLESTPEDVFGRVKGKYCITAANVAKCEQYHCVIVFKKPDPMDFGCNEVADYIETGWNWVQRAHDFDPLAQNPLFLWNCTNRGGASIRHGHAQVVLGRGSHYAKVEHLRRAALDYEDQYGANYFEDLFHIHQALGLGWKSGDAGVMVYLTALKQNEIMMLGPDLTASFVKSLARMVVDFRDKLRVKSFNLGIVFPPLGDGAGWERFPVIARLLDRGDTSSISSDISAMELYGANVVTSDPWETAQALRQ